MRTSPSELGRIHTSGDAPNPTPAKHDILMVNDYLISGLIDSAIDRWFVGPVPTFTPEDLGGTKRPAALHEAIANARRALEEHSRPRALVSISPVFSHRRRPPTVQRPGAAERYFARGEKPGGAHWRIGDALPADVRPSGGRCRSVRAGLERGQRQAASRSRKRKFREPRTNHGKYSGRCGSTSSARVFFSDPAGGGGNRQARSSNIWPCGRTERPKNPPDVSSLRGAQGPRS
jgi:hypothetical protein